MTEKPRAADPAAPGGAGPRDRPTATRSGSSSGTSERSIRQAAEPKGEQTERRRRRRRRQPRRPADVGAGEPQAGRRDGAGRRCRRDGDRRGRAADGGRGTAGCRRAGAELEALRTELDERTRDLQRVTAEYANYRKRVDRDRGAGGRADHRRGARGAAAGARRPRPGPRARRPGRAVRHGGRAAHRGAGQVRADRLRREGRPVRPDPARGGRAPDLGRRHGADLRRGHAPGLPCWASGCCGRRWSRWPTRSDDQRPAHRHGGRDQSREEVDDELQGLAGEGLLRRARRVRSPPPPTRSRRRTASWPGSCTPTTTRATPRPRSGSRPSPRRTTCCPTSKKRKEYDEMRSLFGSGRVPARRPYRWRRSGRLRPVGPVRRLRRRWRRGPSRRAATGASAAPASPTSSARSSPAAGRRGSRAARPAGRDVEAEVTLDFGDAVQGATLPLTLRAPGVCDTCHGNGAKPGTQPRTCPACHGSGLITRNQGSFSFSEPCRECQGVGHDRRREVPGVPRHRRGHQDPHAQRPLPGRGRRRAADPAGRPGRAGRARRPAGDLYVLVKVRADDLFGAVRRRPDADRADHLSRRRCSAPTCGCPRWTATVTLRVPPGTPSGRVLRARGQGRGASRDGQAGDLLVTVEVVSADRADRRGAQGAGGVRRCSRPTPAREHSRRGAPIRSGP